MQDTQGLDALATLCGYTAAATSEANCAAHEGAAPCNSLVGTVLSPQQTVDSAMASLLAQQQQIQQQQQQQQVQQALQVQQVLTMHRATAAQHQQQQLQQQIVNLPSQFVEQAQQIEKLIAMQQIQQQQPMNSYGPGLQALAAQLLVAQQQQVNSGSASLAPFPGKIFFYFCLSTHFCLCVLASFPSYCAFAQLRCCKSVSVCTLITSHVIIACCRVVCSISVSHQQQ